MQRVIRCAQSLVFVALLLGCDAFDRSLLRRFPPPDDNGQTPPPDAGMDSGAPLDSSTPMDSATPLDSSTLMDSATLEDAELDAASDASDDASDDAGCDAATCVDLCPNDSAKTEPGACGCGVAETLAADCTALRTALRHRYRFDGTGNIATDAVGDADGDVINALLAGDSTLTLAGGTTNQHVELPAGIISALTDATFEAWVTWQGGSAWQRIFDFGSSSGSFGQTYVFVTPQYGGTGCGGDSATLCAAFSLDGLDNEVALYGPTALSTGMQHHVVLVVDDLVDLRVYVDGVLQNSTPNTTRSLSSLNDIENWLGRSHFSGDVGFSGVYHEFRIYNAALTAEKVAASFTLGPDPAFLD